MNTYDSMTDQELLRLLDATLQNRSLTDRIEKAFDTAERVRYVEEELTGHEGYVEMAEARHETLENIHRCLDGKAWNADTCDAITMELERLGYTIAAPLDEPEQDE